VPHPSRIEEGDMAGPLITVMVVEGVFLTTCFVVGFLVGVAWWREREHRRRRRDEADRRRILRSR
jgi:cbb3-type cytochrome oxidase subunit 3